MSLRLSACMLFGITLIMGSCEHNPSISLVTKKPEEGGNVITQSKLDPQRDIAKEGNKRLKETNSSALDEQKAPEKKQK